MADGGEKDRPAEGLRAALTAVQKTADRRRREMGWFIGQVEWLSRARYRERGSIDGLKRATREVAQREAHLQATQAWMRDALAARAAAVMEVLQAGGPAVAGPGLDAAVAGWAAFRDLLARREASLHDLRVALAPAQAAAEQLLGDPRLHGTARKIVGKLLRRGERFPAQALRARLAETATLLQAMTHSPLETGFVYRDLAPDEPEPTLPFAEDLIAVDLVVLPDERVLHCLDAIWRNPQRTAFEIILPIDPLLPTETRAAIDAAAGEGMLTLVDVAEPLDWEGALDWASRLHPKRDLVLLAGSCLVYRDWLDRLGAAAYSEAGIARVTPFSNDGAAAGYPYATTAAGIPGDVDPEHLDSLCAQANPGLRIRLEGAGQFCSLYRRPWLAAGRPAERVELLASDGFVYHHGRARPATGPEARTPRDAAFAARRRIDCARMAAEADAQERDWPPAAMLLVTHDLGGGVERHVKAMAERLEAEGTAALMLHPLDGDEVVLSRLGVAPVPSARFALPADAADLADALRAAGVRHLHYHHLLRQPTEVLHLPGLLGLAYDVTFHDFYTVCPRVNMRTGDGGDCEGGAGCGVCATADGPVPVAERVGRYRDFLAGARRRFAPSADTARRIRSRLPELEITVRPHVDDLVATPDLFLPRAPGEALRVAVVGAMQPHKGSSLLLDCARDAAARELPLSFHLIGPADNAEALVATGRVTVSGRYEEAEVVSLLAARRCHLMLLPSVVPETFSYTLSLAIASGIWPVVLDLGAPAERLRALGWGSILPRDADAGGLNDAMLALQPAPLPPDRRAAWAARPADLLGGYYGLMPPAASR